MSYFSPKSWARMESPVLALRVWGAFQWHRSTHRYTRALRTLRSLAPAGLAHASRVPLTDSIVLGVKEQGDTLIIELHGSTHAGTDERMQGGRAQLVFRGAQVRNRPPRGSWILQEEWSEITQERQVGPRNRFQALPDAAARRFRFTALCSRGLLCIDCDDAELVIREVNPQSGIITNAAFAGVQVGQPGVR